MIALSLTFRPLCYKPVFDCLNARAARHLKGAYIARCVSKSQIDVLRHGVKLHGSGNPALLLYLRWQSSTTLHRAGATHAHTLPVLYRNMLNL